MQTNVYDQLVAKTLPLITAYHADLLEHDKNEITRYPDTAFLHWTREYGTHILMLHPPSMYPAKYERVPYLFGTADREHILEQVLVIARYHADPKNGSHTCYYFNGDTLKQVTNERAVTIAQEYLRSVRSVWRNS